MTKGLFMDIQGDNIDESKHSLSPSTIPIGIGG